MSDKRYVPVEEQSLSFPFFIVASLLCASALWAVWDETFTRRPWKTYQNKFMDLQLERGAEELKAAQDRRASPEVMGKEQALTTELESVRTTLAEMKASGEYNRAIDEVARLQTEIVKQQQQHSFRKAEGDQFYYEWKHAEHDAYPPDQVRKLKERYYGVMVAADKVQVIVDDLQRQRADVWASYSEKEQKIEQLTGDLDRLDAEVQAAERKINTFQRGYPEILQVVNDDLHIVDRCPSCHVGVEKAGWDDPAKVPPVFRTHPHKKQIFANHPSDRFGCTPCHGGQGTSTQEFFAHAQGGENGLDPKKYMASFHSHYWERPLLLSDYELVLERDDQGEPIRTGRLPFVQSSCRGCHTEDRDLALAPNLNRGRRLIEKVGCFGCHNIPGMEEGTIRKVGPSLTGFGSKASAGWLVRWIANPKDFRPTTRMPNFWPEALDADGKDMPGSEGFQTREREATAIAAYVWANGQGFTPDTRGYDAAADPKLGEQLISDVGCMGCHPSGLDDEQRLAHQRLKGVPEPPKPGEIWGADVAIAVNDHGPTLTGVGSKLSAEWIYAWVKNPRSYWPDTRMPSLRLTDGEASAIANHLATWKREGKEYPKTPDSLKVLTPDAVQALAAWDGLDEARKKELSEAKAMVDEGARLINKYGCSGCHDIRGFETAGKVAPDLSLIGGKDPHLLDFGDFITVPEWATWEAFVYNKIRTPRVFAHPRAELKMPWFGLPDRDIFDIMVYLKSLTPEAADMHTDYKRALTSDQAAVEQGRRLVEEYNCKGCHVVEDQGGYVRTRYTVAEQNTSIPPYLTGEGAKVKPDWFFDFLNNVEPLRPWLKIRMPSFDMPEEHAQTIVHYFTSLDGKRWPFEYQPAPEPSVAEFKQAHDLFESLKCEKCHPADAAAAKQAAASGGGGLAPRLDLARARLRQDWLADWLRDPERLQPGTRMPAFFYSFGSTDPTDWFEDLADGPSRVRWDEGFSKLTVFAGALPDGDDLRLDWADAKKGGAVHELKPGFQLVQVERFAWPTAGKKTDETPPVIAQISFKTPQGKTVRGLVNLLGPAGEQRQLQAATTGYPDAEERIGRLVRYLELLPQRNKYLARLAPPPAGEAEAPAAPATKVKKKK